jgi:adenylosuccinate lyase
VSGPHERWTTPEMLRVFSRRATTEHYHQVWLDVLRIQIAAGVVDDPDGQIYRDYEGTALAYQIGPEFRAEYHAVLDQLEQSIEHELKAHIDVFDRYSDKHGKIHLGMTSSDVTEVTWQAQTLQALELLHERLLSVAVKMTDIASLVPEVTVGRTHGQPAQVTTIGKRLADCAQEVIIAVEAVQALRGSYPMRGVVGAVGTSADVVELAQQSGLSPVDTTALANAVRCVGSQAQPRLLNSVGQCYPRLLDAQVSQVCVQATAALRRFATSIRLLSMLGLAQEGRGDQAVGSSAMPHKVNPRFSERICGLHQLAIGYSLALEAAAGDQWLEGDVANSCVRRVALPGVFYAADGACASAAHVLNTIDLKLGRQGADLRDHLPELATGRLLALAVARGVSREVAHERLRQHAAAAIAGQQSGLQLPITQQEIKDTIAETATATGVAHQRKLSIISEVGRLLEDHKGLGGSGDWDALLEWKPEVR